MKKETLAQKSLNVRQCLQAQSGRLHTLYTASEQWTANVGKEALTIILIVNSCKEHSKVIWSPSRHRVYYHHQEVPITQCTAFKTKLFPWHINTFIVAISQVSLSSNCIFFVMLITAHKKSLMYQCCHSQKLILQAYCFKNPLKRAGRDNLLPRWK